MSEELKKATPWFNYQFHVDCPHCEKQIDLVDGDDGTMTRPIFNNNPEILKGETIWCDGCEQDFQLDEVEYE